MSRSTTNDFEVLSRLGAGSFGTVYKVRRFADDAIYVIKNVRIMELSRKEQAEAINEVQILAQLKSPYVVRYYDSFIERDSLHIVMEFCNRGDLQNLLKKAQEKNVPGLRESVVWNMCLQVILGLHYLHKKRILHRDLKTANVFLMKNEHSPNYLVKIGDLGVAKLMDTSTAFAKTIVGTPYYLSPELCKDLPYRDRSDCWALGVLMYECCTLQRPFEAKNQCALIMKIIESPVVIPSTTSLTPQLANLLLWLLQKDPDRRPCVRDILCEQFVREKLAENHFELPEEAAELAATNYLTLGFSNYGAVERARSVPRIEAAEEKIIDVEVEGSGPAIARKPSQREVRQLSNRQLELETNDGPQPKLGRLPSKRSNTNLVPSIRGDRVRGSNRRLLSEKALNRYQTQPMPISSSNLAALERNMSSTSATLSRAESKAMEQSPRRSTKDDDEDAQCAPVLPLDDSKTLSSSKMFSRSMKDLKAADDEDDAVAPLQSEGELFEGHASLRASQTANSWNITQRAGQRLQDTNFSTSSLTIHPGSAGSTTELPNLELEGDSEFWNTVNMQRRTSITDTQQPLHTVVETDETASPTAKSPASTNDGQEFNLDTLAAYIVDLREEVSAILGEELFNDVYDLVERHMYDSKNPEDQKNEHLLQDLASIFEQEPQIDFANACDIAFKVKIILALESKYDTLCDDESKNNRK